MSALVRRYKYLLHERPFITNVCTSCAFMTTGDLISQCIKSTGGFRDPASCRVDLRQTARFALAGFIFVGPTVRCSLVLIDKLFGPTTSLRVLAKKLFTDQCLIAPLFLCGNISTLAFLKSRSLEQVKLDLKRSYVGLLKTNYSFWPFVQVINFYFIPLAYRVPFGSSAALIWITILSYRLSDD